MKGLWQVPTITIDPGRGIAVFDFLVAFIVIGLTFTSLMRRSGHWPEAQMLHIGMVLLSIWLLLHWIDVVIRHNQVVVSFSYILVGCIYNVFRVLSDVLVLCGTVTILPRYSTVETRKYKTPLACVTGLFLFLGLYHVCLLFGLSFAWLSFSDLGVINAIAKARNGFEIAFTASQFIATFGIIGEAFAGGVRRQDKQEREFLQVASIALLLRSLCEVTTVGQLDRRPLHIQRIYGVRDVMYGLWSTAFVICITGAIPSKTAEDPLVKEKEARDQAEQAAQATALEEVKGYIMTKLIAATEDGKKTAPTISSVLDALESELHPPQSPTYNDPYDIYGTKMREIDALREYYAEWEPIYRWQGPE
ncbi:MAG: hypothetical protein M1840_003798 [Geoglossum simile]|nr:MAG: hypothetical protein M1840_003798 [Geoglossum simile]